MKTNITVMLIEDSSAFRKAISRALKIEPDMELISEFATAEIALRSLQGSPSRDQPDVVLLDLNLPGMSGQEAIPWIKRYSPTTEIIVLTQSDHEADVLTAISAGASGYLLKSTTRDRLEESIRTVADGGSILDASVARFILSTMRKRAPKTLVENKLTDRELEILQLIGEGLEKKQIGVQLEISPKTVAVHATHIYQKLNVHNAPAAVAKAYKTGLLGSEK